MPHQRPSRRIKELEAHGLVVRSMNPAMPQSNLYSLSSDGEQLSPVMQSLYDWAENWTIPSSTAPAGVMASVGSLFFRCHGDGATLSGNLMRKW